MMRWIPLKCKLESKFWYSKIFVYRKKNYRRTSLLDHIYTHSDSHIPYQQQKITKFCSRISTELFAHAPHHQIAYSDTQKFKFWVNFEQNFIISLFVSEQIIESVRQQPYMLLKKYFWIQFFPYFQIFISESHSFNCMVLSNLHFDRDAACHVWWRFKADTSSNLEKSFFLPEKWPVCTSATK